MKLIHLLLVGLCPVLRPSAQEPIPTPSTIVHPSALHLPITRRGGRFSNTDVANLTYLLEELSSIESRYSATRRVIKGNRVVRKPKPVKIGADGDGGEGLLGSIGKPGGWFADLRIGTPAQHLQMDLDMLSSDFWIRTTGDKGSKGFDEIFSSTYQPDVGGPPYSYPYCHLATDMFTFLTMPAPSNLTTRLAYSQCRPNKAGRRTLETSGSMLGLAPAKSLVQMDATNILQQLAQSKGISEPVWSLTLLDGESGVLSIGGTIAEEVLRAEHETENALNALGQIEQMASKGEAAPEKEGTELDAEQLADLSKVDSGTTLKKRSIDAEELTSPPVQQKARLTKRTNLKSTRQESWRDLFMWTKVQGAQGWWQILMNGVWVEGVRVLKNQPVIIDINTPFTLAPPLAARNLYSSIPGAARLPPPYSNFYSFPCLNPPVLAFEFATWMFPVFQGGLGIPLEGGERAKMSLGKLDAGSGMCVGVIVEMPESMIGARDGPGKRRKKGTKTERVLGDDGAGNGLRDIWVLGETFWRGIGGVFDWEKQLVGMRVY